MIVELARHLQHIALRCAHLASVCSDSSVSRQLADMSVDLTINASDLEQKHVELKRNPLGF